MLLISLLLCFCFASFERCMERNPYATFNASRTRVVIKVLHGFDIDSLSEAHHYECIGASEPLHFVLQETAVDAEHARRKRAALPEHAAVHWHAHQAPRQLIKRVVRDPLFSKQWHLATGNPASVNVARAWSEGVTGKNVTVCIIDDGLQYDHPDLAENFFRAGSYDYNGGDQDVAPNPRTDDHGTSAGGACCAVNNVARGTASRFSDKFCGVGVAYDARLSAVRLISLATEDWQEAKGISYAADKNDVYSASWGPPDDGKRLEGPGPLATAARSRVAREGRNGLGSIYVWAGGNGRKRGDNCNYDGWANSIYALTVGSIGQSRAQPWFSEDCASMVAVAPSSGGGPAITTTDLMGAAGSNSGHCTSSFGGTSASAPIAAGIVALVLEVRPDLTWRDMQGVFVHAARPAAIADRAGWQTNGAGLQCSEKYGFGLIDASAAVDVARQWRTTRSNIGRIDSKTVSVGSTIKANRKGTASYTVSGQQARTYVQHVELAVSATVKQRGRVEVRLRHAGTTSVLAVKRGDTGRNIRWKFVSVLHWDEFAEGEWELELYVNGAGTSLTFTAFQLVIHTSTHKGFEGLKAAPTTTTTSSTTTSTTTTTAKPTTTTTTKTTTAKPTTTSTSTTTTTPTTTSTTTTASK